MPAEMVDYLVESLGLTSDDVFFIEGQLMFLIWSRSANSNRPDLKYRSLRPSIPDVLKHGRPIF